ncbi:MAG: hypothetical protein ACKOQZ_10265 [Actinomycetota bacterium]
MPRPLRVVADTANGMGGLVVPEVFARLADFEIEVMYAELDGTFPNHPADPLQPAMKATTWSANSPSRFTWSSVPATFAGAGSSPSRTPWAMRWMSRSPLSMPIDRAPARQHLMPLYCAGLCEAVNIAPGMSSFPDA